jgi:hypothetical protein
MQAFRFVCSLSLLLYTTQHSAPTAPLLNGNAVNLLLFIRNKLTGASCGVQISRRCDRAVEN